METIKEEEFGYDSDDETVERIIQYLTDASIHDSDEDSYISIDSETSLDDFDEDITLNDIDNCVPLDQKATYFRSRYITLNLMLKQLLTLDKSDSLTKLDIYIYLKDRMIETVTKLDNTPLL